MKPKILLSLFAAAALVTTVCLVSFVVIGTRSGAGFMTRHALPRLADADSRNWDTIVGSLASGIIYQNFLIQDLAAFPVPNRLEIQTLKVDFDWRRFWQIPDLEIENGKLTLPDADPVLFYGHIKDQTLNLNVFTRTLDQEDLLALAAALMPDGLAWELSDLDVSITGSVAAPVVQGSVGVSRIDYDGFQFRDAPCEFRLTLNPASHDGDPQGYLKIFAGTVRGRRTAEIQLEESQVFFDGSFLSPHLDIAARANVEKIQIDIHLNGTPEAPALTLSSTPPFGQERLMLALATGQTWQRTEDLVTQGVMTPQITRDFISYFLFGDRRNEFARRLGLSEISVDYSETTRGLSVRKDLSDRLEGGYNVEQTLQPDGTSDVSQTVGGAYKITDRISVEASRQVTASTDPAKTQEPPMVDDKVLFKIQTPF